MRRAAPILIVIIGVIALVLDFWPGLKLPVVGDPNGATRVVETKLGLDLVGGFQVEYQVIPAGGRSPTSSDMDTTKAIIESRINSLGVSEPVVQTQGTDRIVVELPGVNDPKSITDLVGQAGLLEFVPLPKDQYGTGGPSGVAGTKAVPVNPDPIDPSLKPLFSGGEIDGTSVQPAVDSTNGQRAVSFTLKSTGSNLFATYTSSHLLEYFAIVLDGQVQSTPYIASAITNGQAQISGSFTVAQQNKLVTLLRYGALPFPLQQVQSAQISSTLAGFDLNHTLVAGLIGIALVFLFMLVYYRLPGVIACLALLYYAMVVLGIFRLVPVTLTLAGIAGFVLSVGMAVDANILIFERTKEELRAGKSLGAAIEAGFNRAWNSILDSNVSSLITATILYWFGSSVIRGFALVLIIGVLTSMFTAITVSRTLLRVVVQREAARKAWMYGVTEEEFLARPTGRPFRGEARGRV